MDGAHADDVERTRRHLEMALMAAFGGAKSFTVLKINSTGKPCAENKVC